MNILKRGLVWLSRIHCCRGFGIQSPTDYAFVRYVVNEHWPYYAYRRLKERDALRRKLGRLYLRLANWRQPSVILADDYHQWWQAGCRSAHVIPHSTFHTPHSTFHTPHSSFSIELARVTIEQHDLLRQLLAHCDQQSVLVVEGIHRHWQLWRAIEADPCVGTTFDLYYCGIVFCDVQRFKHHYKINF